MHYSLIDLQEINKDVLLGKRNANCISCAKGQDGYEVIKNVQGQDGRLYMTSGKASIGKGINTTENRSRSRSPKGRKGNKSSITHLKKLDDLIEVEIDKKV